MVSVRILGALGFILAAGEAQASSIVVLGAPSSTPSVVRLGAPGSNAGHLTPSIVALGTAEPDVTYEKVAAIANRPEHKRGFQQGLMIIRGGIVGGDFSVPMPSAAPAAAPQAESSNKTEAANSPQATQPATMPETDKAK